MISRTLGRLGSLEPQAPSGIPPAKLHAKADVMNTSRPNPRLSTSHPPLRLGATPGLVSMFRSSGSPDPRLSAMPGELATPTGSIRPWLERTPPRDDRSAMMDLDS